MLSEPNIFVFHNKNIQNYHFVYYNNRFTKFSQRYADLVIALLSIVSTSPINHTIFLALVINVYNKLEFRNVELGLPFGI